ncbi:SMC-Scp complex subunit ScpB, partial [Candidatus Woesearchaeota archaeon]|nr:SMC-Scp complex subunit ScpB [Candidatus Woesearchaeota archaeon]
MEDLGKKIEAVLFSAGKKVAVSELSRLCRAKPEEIVEELKKLREDYESRNSSLMVVEEGDSWKITVREKHLPLVQKIVAETELSRTIMETLAVVAWKAPVLQSDIIRIRTNKAYDHLRELEDNGFISRSKHGRTQLIKLTDKFFSYFDLKGKEDVEKRFGKFKEAATAIEKLEQKEESPEEPAEEEKAGEAPQEEPVKEEKPAEETAEEPVDEEKDKNVP